MNKLIAGIELESGYYNMKLNKGKCEVIAMNCNSNIHFSECARLKSVSEAKYLGGNISRAADSRTEVEARISATMGVVYALNTFWNKARCDFAWKLQV